jgi:hypothetical protein
MPMKLSQEDMVNIECFRARAKTLLEQGNKHEARLLNMYALQIINNCAIDVMSAQGAEKGETLIYSDLSMTVPGPDFAANITSLDLNLTTGSPLYNDILKVLEAHRNDEPTA